MQKEIKIKHVKFFKETGFTKNDFFYEKAIIYTIVDENVILDDIEKLSDNDIEQIITK